MSRLLCRAVVMLLAAACSRSPPSSSLSPAASSPFGPESARPAGTQAATRVTPPPGTRPIRPRPAPCLPAVPSPSAAALAEEGRRALEAGQQARALDCSEQAARLAPRQAAALSVRADALVALGRLDEARLAFARALAVDPENPVALLGAAELYVRHLSDQRDAIEIGLEYALRGARAALRARDRELAGELQLVAGIAENDSGRTAPPWPTSTGRWARSPTIRT